MSRTIRTAGTGQSETRPRAASNGATGCRAGAKPAECALLGTDHDERIAARVGRSVDTVSRKRRELGIPAYRDRRGRRPNPAG